MPDFQYRKSSYSDSVNECVEVATNNPTTIAIRDSKHPTGPSLRVSPIMWATFKEALTSGLLKQVSESA